MDRTVIRLLSQLHTPPLPATHVQVGRRQTLTPLAAKATRTSNQRPRVAHPVGVEPGVESRSHRRAAPRLPFDPYRGRLGCVGIVGFPGGVATRLLTGTPTGVLWPWPYCRNRAHFSARGLLSTRESNRQKLQNLRAPSAATYHWRRCFAPSLPSGAGLCLAPAVGYDDSPGGPLRTQPRIEER